MSSEACWEWGRWTGTQRGLLSVRFSSQLLHILCASDLQSFLKRTQPQLLSLSIPTFISISLSCLIETVLRFTHTEPFIKNASYKKSTMQLLNLGSTKASSFRFHLWENRVPKGPTLIHLSLEDSLFKAQWSSSFELWMQTGGTCQQMITMLDWFQLQMIGKKPVKRMYYH